MSKKKDICKVWLDTKKTVEQRVELLLAEMTLEEKVDQTGGSYFGDIVIGDGDYGADPNVGGASSKKNVAKTNKYKFSPEKMQEVIDNLGTGVLQNYVYHSYENPEDNIEGYINMVNEAQEYILNNTRLGIPALVTTEGVHGHWAPEATVFPHAISVASSWDTALIKKMGEIVAKEARAAGAAQLFSPVLELAREPRWSRMQETYGEDPYLVERMGVEYIKGVQGKEPLLGREHCAATAKHYVAHGSPEGGLNHGPVSVGSREMKQMFLRPFEAAVKEAGVLSVMPAYHEIDGVPLACHYEYLTKVLRHEWGFKGYTFSDWGSVEMLMTRHFVAGTLEETGKMALEAGMDVDAPVKSYGFKLVKMVKEGKVDVKYVDEAVRRVLRLKFILGLFENPYGDLQKTKKIRNCVEHKNFARKVAQESIILLKNEGNILPFGKDIKSIAVIGPNATEAQLGDYCVAHKNILSPLDGIKKRAPKGVKVEYAKGCDLWKKDDSGFAEAVALAEKSDVSVLFIGEAKEICNEGRDMHFVELAGVQEELVKKIVATGKPVVVVLVNGRSLAIPWIAENVPAILETWFAGEEQGNAIADILWGDVNPSGKLPVSLPRSTGHLPVFYNHKPSARGSYKKRGSPEKLGMDYLLSAAEPLFEFGYGLSYTTFKYSELKITPKKILPAGEVTVSVKVKNTGKREGAEVVQLYINDIYSSMETPIKQLRRFEKVWLKPNEERNVVFTLKPEDLAFVNLQMEWMVEPGEFEVMVGNLKKTFVVE